MSRRYKGLVPVAFMTLPHLGEVHPGTVLTGADADAVAGRPDFELVDEPAEAAAAQENDAPAEPAAAKPRRPAAPKAETA